MAKKSKATSAKSKNKAAASTGPPPPQRRNAVIDAANAVVDVMADFQPFATFTRNELTASITNVHANALLDSQKAAIVALFEANMMQMYANSDWGYNALEKQAELFDNDARYLLATAENSEELLGFVHFRFVEDEGANALYIFEIQIASPAQRKGLGKLLMQLLTLVARKHAMELLMLTVFKTNTAAMQFYQHKLGFEIDETSPSANGDATQSYEILSKAIPVAGKR